LGEDVCHLKKLRIILCGENPLQNLFELGDLKELRCINCTFSDLVTLHNLLHLKKLNSLIVENCKELKTLKGLPQSIRNLYFMWSHFYNNISHQLASFQLNELHEYIGTGKFDILVSQRQCSHSWISCLDVFNLNKLYDYFYFFGSKKPLILSYPDPQIP